tara:strand:+ start:2312 stop:3181 length:870 start_codon:yes stop_codon:yes gene_type:complete
MKKDTIIIGHGFVGRAVEKVLLQSKLNIEIVDPKYFSTLEDFKELKPKFIFVCVPTPAKRDGMPDYSILKSVINESIKVFPNAIQIVKSTILPNALDFVSNRNERIVCNPEFLTEKNALKDLINADFQIFGGDLKNCKEAERFLKDFSLCKFKRSHFVSIEVASLIKLSINSFLALKVIFFNQIKEIFSSLDLGDDQYDQYIKGIALDKRIGDSHMSVPGHDGRFGFGGACFPKDTEALLSFFEENKKSFSLLAEAIKINNDLRSDYNNLLDREREQNISFKSNKGIND